MVEEQTDLESMLAEKGEAINRLKYWRDGGDSFTCQLYSLIQKADPANRMRIRKGFPTEVEVWNEWYCSPTEESFFEKYGLPGGAKK